MKEDFMLALLWTVAVFFYWTWLSGVSVVQSLWPFPDFPGIKIQPSSSRAPFFDAVLSLLEESVLNDRYVFIRQNLLPSKNLKSITLLDIQTSDWRKKRMLLLSCFIYFKFQMKECLCVIMPALLNLTFTSHREFAHLVHLLKKKKKRNLFPSILLELYSRQSQLQASCSR